MGNRQEEFLARLRETFREEAAEHIAAISQGLLLLERGTSDERAATVELVFREAHSLKGAARAVGLARVESLCLEVEGVFAGMKRGEVEASPELLDAIHAALGVLSGACDRPGASPEPGEVEKQDLALTSLRQALQTPPSEPGAEQAAGSPERTAPAAERSEADPEASAGHAPDPRHGPDTVRISANKLGALLRDSEELLGAKLASHAHAAELLSVATELQKWNRQRVRDSRGWRRQPDEGSVEEIIESEQIFSRSLEGSLRRVASHLRQDALSLGANLERLREHTRAVLLMPCSYLLSQLAPALRDMARAQGKEVDMVVAGEDIQVDRRILDELKDPFIHLLRNCVDHGLESPADREARGKPARGTVTVTVQALRGSRVEFSVRDDGAGIDVGKVKEHALRLRLVESADTESMTDEEVVDLTFRSGLSTSPIITDLSGRGLGLAIVREKVDRLGGTIRLESTPGSGTTFSLVIPLSLSAFRGVLVKVGDRSFFLPTASVRRVARVRPDEIRTVENRQVVSVGERAMSAVRLRDVLEFPDADRSANGATLPAVVLQAVGEEIAFLVDAVIDEQEVVVRDLGPHLPRVRNVSGAALTGSGAVVPILNPLDLVESARSAGLPTHVGTDAEPAEESRSRLLVVEDSITSRMLIKGILEGAGYEVVAAVDGVDALAKLRSDSFDLVVSDVDMPRMNGFELTGKIRSDKKLGELPVVLVTALGSEKDREYGVEVGANAYIVKSDFDQGHLLGVVRRLV